MGCAPRAEQPVLHALAVGCGRSRRRHTGGDGRVHLLGRWSHLVSTRGRGVLACPTSCAEPIDGSATFTTRMSLAARNALSGVGALSLGLLCAILATGRPPGTARGEAGHRSRLSTRGFQEVTRAPRATGHRFGPHDRCVCCPPCGGIGRSSRFCLAASVMGSPALAASALPGSQWVSRLKGVWCAVPLFSLCKTFRGSGQPERDGSSNSPTVSTRPGAGQAAKG